MRLRRAISRAFNKQLNARPFELQIISVRAGISPPRVTRAERGLVKYAGRNVYVARDVCMHYVALRSRVLTNRSYGSQAGLGRGELLLLISMHTTP